MCVGAVLLFANKELEHPKTPPPTTLHPTHTARGGKKKRFRHRESTFLRTPKIPAADLNIADVVCPLRDVPYSQQLLVKQEKVIDALTMLTKKVVGVVFCCCFL